MTILLKGPAQQFTVVGIVGFGSTDNLAGATIAAFDVTSAQKYVGTPGTYTDLAIASQDGVSQKELAKRVSAVLPKGFEAVTQQQSADEASKAIKEGLGFFSTALLVFAAISLFVGGFLIFNTFSMLIAQRTRELALMRALGASRRQVTISVLVEALIVGLFSSALGFVLGIGVAKGLNALLGALGIDLPVRRDGHRDADDRRLARRRRRCHLRRCAAARTQGGSGCPGRGASRVRTRRGPVAASPRPRRRRVDAGRRRAAGDGVVERHLEGRRARRGSELPRGRHPVALHRPADHWSARPAVRQARRAGQARPRQRDAQPTAYLRHGGGPHGRPCARGRRQRARLVAEVEHREDRRHLTRRRLHPAHRELHALQRRGRQGPARASPASSRSPPSASARPRSARARHRSRVSSPEALAAVLKLTPVSGKFADLATGIAISKKAAKDHGWKVGDTIPVTWRRTGLHPLKVAVIYDINQFAGDYLVSGRRSTPTPPSSCSASSP